MDENSAEAMKDQIRAAQEAKMLEIIRKDKEAGRLPIFDQHGNAITDQDKVEERQKELEKAKLDQLDAELGALMDGDKELMATAQSLRWTYQMLFWLLSEAASHKGVNAKHMDYLSRMTREAAMRAPVDAETIKGQVKQNVLPHIMARDKSMRVFAQSRVDRLGRMSKKFITTGMELKPLTDKPVKLSAPIMVYFGKADAVKEATKQLVKSHKAQYDLKPVVLAANPDDIGKDDAVVMPPAWWQGAMEKSEGVHGVLDPVLDQKTALVIVENAVKMQQSQEKTLHSVAEMARWMKHNFVFGAIGIVDDEDIQTSPDTSVQIVKVELVDNALKCTAVSKGR